MFRKLSLDTYHRATPAYRLSNIDNLSLLSEDLFGKLFDHDQSTGENIYQLRIRKLSEILRNRLKFYRGDISNRPFKFMGFEIVSLSVDKIEDIISHRKVDNFFRVSCIIEYFD